MVGMGVVKIVDLRFGLGWRKLVDGRWSIWFVSMGPSRHRELIERVEGFYKKFQKFVCLCVWENVGSVCVCVCGPPGKKNPIKDKKNGPFLVSNQ